jgi:choline dehydrogenase-like flavoprotein
MAQERFDVLVVGSGAAGAALSWRLTEAGARVVCLEQGDWINPGSFPSVQPTYESHLVRGDFHFDPNVRRRPEDYPVTTAGSNPPSIAMFNAVGGTTIHWQAHFPRFHPSDFRVRTQDGVADDWPIRYDDLAPYYELNDRIMGVSGLAGDPANPPRSPRQTAPLPIGKLGDVLVRGFEALGWHWWVADQAIISEPYDGRPPCQLHGKCMFGCPIGAKASTDRTYWPKALAKGAVLKTRARVREISVDSGGRVRGAVYFDADGTTHEELARVIVICCNGIGTPRLLLNSTSNRYPDGLANSSGLVGTHFMIHPGRYIEGIFEEPLDGHIGPMGNPLYSQQFYETDTRRGFVRGYTLVAERTFGPFAHALGHAFDVPWGLEHHRVMRQRFPHTAGITVVGDDLPDPDNRIDLDSSKADSSGVPAARATYSLGENTRRMLEHGAARATELLKAAGAIEVLDPGNGNMAHLMGTARMGLDPANSVVDAWNQAHEVPNLFIVDGSSFTTAAGVNPTSTIGALALRAADGIWRHRREWI